MEPKLTKHVKAWLNALDLPWELDYFGGGFYGVSIQLNDDRYIVLTDQEGDTVPQSVLAPCMASITNTKNELWVSFYCNRLKDFHIHQCF
jgi:hypothetical protein